MTLRKLQAHSELFLFASRQLQILKEIGTMEETFVLHLRKFKDESPWAPAHPEGSFFFWGTILPQMGSASPQLYPGGYHGLKTEDWVLIS